MSLWGGPVTQPGLHGLWSGDGVGCLDGEGLLSGCSAMVGFPVSVLASRRACCDPLASSSLPPGPTLGSLWILPPGSRGHLTVRVERATGQR